MCTHAAAWLACPATALSTETHQQEVAWGRKKGHVKPDSKGPGTTTPGTPMLQQTIGLNSFEFIGKGKQSLDMERNSTAK